ncbi:MAG: hypothetical protein WBY12_03955, partial [Hyphomicrobium sp.]
ELGARALRRRVSVTNPEGNDYDYAHPMRRRFDPILTLCGRGPEISVSLAALSAPAPNHHPLPTATTLPIMSLL